MLRPVWDTVEGWVGRGHPGGGAQKAVIDWHSTSGNSSDQGRDCPGLLDKEENSAIPSSSLPFQPPVGMGHGTQ